jgi:hypothetical protein
LAAAAVVVLIAVVTLAARPDPRRVRTTARPNLVDPTTSSLLPTPTTTAPTTSPTTAVPPALDPADSATPTAGGCSLASGGTANVVITPDFVPSPRCVVVSHNQSLSFTNRTGQVLHARLGSRTATAPDGSTYTFPGSVGSYLAPGVHKLVFSPASSADIWVDAVCQGPDASNCSTP